MPSFTGDYRDAISHTRRTFLVLNGYELAADVNEQERIIFDLAADQSQSRGFCRLGSEQCEEELTSSEKSRYIQKCIG